MRASRNAVAIVAFIAVLGSLVVANVRERSRDPFAIAVTVKPKPRNRGFGWPLVAYWQSVPSGGAAKLIDEDFPGGDDQLIPALQSPVRGWASINRPVSKVHLPSLVVDLLILFGVSIGTATTAVACVQRGAQWSLRALFIWLTCASVIFALTISDYANGSWWNLQEAYAVEWIEIINVTVLATGCACGANSFINVFFSRPFQGRRRAGSQ